MDIDFHYYATYIASRCAGFNQRTAQLIAFYAEYVDETYSREGYIEDDSIRPERTTFDAITLRHTELPGMGGNDLKTLRVWVPFHFLPGNFDTNRYRYNGDADKLSAEDKWRLAMLCDNGSRLSTDMKEDSVSPAPWSNVADPMGFRVALVGIRMHVLADTFAHAGFAGFGSKMANEVSSVQAINAEGVPYGPMDDWAVMTRSPLAVASFGHGRIGHLPDRSSARYQWVRPWDGQSFVRHNPDNYAEAFDSLTHTLKTIKDAWLKIYPEKAEALIDDPRQPPWSNASVFFANLGSSEVFMSDSAYKEDREFRFKSMRKLIQEWCDHDIGDYLGDHLFKTWGGLSSEPKQFVINFSVAATHHQKWTEGALVKYTGGLENRKAFSDPGDCLEVEERRAKQNHF